MFEIVIYAVVALFLIYRLWSVLGQRGGFEPTEGDVGFDPVVTLDTNPLDGHSLKPDLAVPEQLVPFIDDLKKYIPDFRLDRFVDLASYAFDIILNAYGRGESQTLAPLLRPDLFQDFQNAIQERIARGETLSTTLVRIDSVTFIRGSIVDDVAALTVRFVTEQIHVITDKKGNIIEGSPKQSEQLTDDWTFEKDLKSKSPVWYLAETSP